MFLAHWLRFAVHLDCMTIVVSTHPNRRLALPAIHPGAFGNHFELAEEVTLEFAILVCENPAVGHRVLLVIGQQQTQLSGERDLPFLVVLREESDIQLALAAYHETKS